MESQQQTATEPAPKKRKRAAAKVPTKPKKIKFVFNKQKTPGSSEKPEKPEQSNLKRKALTIEEKAKIIWRLETGETNRDIASDFDLSHSTISTIWKNREKIKQAFEMDSLTPKKIRKPKNEGLEEALLKWFKAQRSNNVPINGSHLLEKAEDITKSLKLGFRPDTSWIQRFRKRHGIVFGNIVGEPPSAPFTNKEMWLSTVWPKIREMYSDDHIFNADETGLFFKLTPDKTFQFKEERSAGGKLPKERITVMVASNMSGTVKRKLLVIGKAKKPRCFKGVQHLPVDYESNSRASMSSELFEKFLHKWDAELRMENRRILLLVDNCPAHPEVGSLTQIQLVFHPTNMISILQPTDEQGVSKSLKVKFRKLVVLQMLKNIKIKKEAANINLLDAVNMIAKAWDDVSMQTIRNCFHHAGFIKPNMGEPSYHFNPLSNMNEIAQGEVWVSNPHVSQNLKIQNFEDYILVDQNLETVLEVTDDDVLSSMHRRDEEREGQSDEEDSGALVTLAEAARAISNVRSFFMASSQEVPGDVINAIKVIEKEIDSALYRKCPKQSRITDFFGRM